MSDGNVHASVLVVDDEPGMQELFREILPETSFSVITAGTTAEAMAALEQNSFNLVILDRKLPGGDGVELLKQLRAEGCHVPILVITGHPSIETAIEALGNYACDYLPKPFNHNDFMSKVNAAVACTVMISD